MAIATRGPRWRLRGLGPARTSGRRITFALAVALVMTALVAAPAAVAELPAGVQVSHELRPGDIVRDNGVGLVVPPPGKWTGADALLDSGGEQSLLVATDLDGTVVLTSLGSEASSSAGGSSGDGADAGSLQDLIDNVDPQIGLPIPEPQVSDPCTDDTYKLKYFYFDDGSQKHYKWKTSYDWWFKDDSTPAGVSVADATEALRNGTWHNTQAYNDCGRPDNVGATASFQGNTSTGTDINATGDLCQDYSNKDGKSVTSFGTLPSHWLAYTCTWGTKDVGSTYAGANESDAKFNKSAHDWYALSPPANCANKWSIGGVATHERGHTFGLGHVSEADHSSLTMSTEINGPCQNTEATLGLGDMKGLEQLY